MEVLNSNSTGRFAFGWLQRFAAGPRAKVDFVTLPSHILPDDPPYLSPRNRDAYSYVFLPDTMLAGRAVRVIEVQALPEGGKKQTIQRARFYLSQNDETLLALELERLEQGLLFREKSQFSITLRLTPDSSGWLPASTLVDVHLNAPFRPPEQFRTTRTFSNFEPVR
jgi:hypothetical protein